MAQGIYENLYKQLKAEREARQSALKASDNSTSSKIKDVQNRTDNMTTRLKAGGVDVEAETDKRNAVEKFLGLPDDQNIVFDIFELLGRPQQAVFGAYNAWQNGEDAWEAAKSHWKGDEETQFKEILEDNRLGLDFKDRKGKVDLIDVLGFTGDVLLDPADLALIPVTMGGSVAASAAINAADAAADTARTVGKTAKAVDAATDAVKAANKASDVAKAVNATDDVVDTAKKIVKKKSLSDLAFEGMGKTIKGAAKLTDSSLEGVLKYLDETKGVTDKMGNIAKIGYSNADADTVADLGKYLRNSGEFLENGKYIPTGRLEKYKEIKETISNAFKLKKGNKEAIRAVKEADFLKKQTKDRITQELKKFDDAVIEFAEKSGMSVDDVNNAMTDMIEYKGLNRVKTGKEVLEAARSGALKANPQTIKVLDELTEAVNKAGRTYGDEAFQLSYKVNDAGVVRLDKNWNKKTLDKVGVSLDDDVLSKQFNLGDNYTKKQKSYLNKLEKNKEFMEFFEEHKSLNNKLNDILGQEFGVDIAKKYAQNEGYVPHNLKNSFKTLGNDIAEEIPELKGNTKVLADRTRLGSILEENTMMSDVIKKNYNKLSDTSKKYVKEHKELFERNYSAAMSKKYLDDLPTLLTNNKVLTDTLVDQSLGSVDEMVKLNKEIKKASLMGDKQLMSELAETYNKKFGESNIKFISDGKVPAGYKALKGKGKNYADKLDKLAAQIGSKDIKKVTNQLRKHADNLAIDSSVLRMIDVLDDSKSVNALSRMCDKWMSFYKTNKVLSPSFHLNNILGNTNNMWLSGINMTEQAKYMPEAARVLSEGAELSARKVAGEALDAADSRIAEVYEILAKSGFASGHGASELQDLPEYIMKYMNGDTSSKNIAKMLPAMSAKLNESFDNLSRSVVIMKGLDDPKYLANLGVDNAADAMRKVLFDPAELTDFERDYVKKIIPFYTFAKKNLAYQLDNLGKNGNRYNKLMKSIESLQKEATGNNEENLKDYIKNNLYIPIPALGEDGSYTIIKAQLPFGNLIDMVDNPTQGFVNLIGPAAKMPYELATNTNSFTGANIEDYEGQMSTQIPFLTKKQQHVLGGLTGLDVPVKNAVNLYQGIQDTLDSGGNLKQGIGQGIKNMTTISGNVENDKLSKMYDNLDELETIMSKYKDRGYEFSTMEELKKANYNYRIDQIMSKLNKYRGIKENPYSYKK